MQTTNGHCNYLLIQQGVYELSPLYCTCFLAANCTRNCGSHPHGNLTRKVLNTMSRELRLMTIPEVLRMANGSVDFPGMVDGLNWGEIFSGKVSHSHFDAIVDTIQRDGFAMPIVLCDRQDGRGYVIGNGHHRLCAAILLGLWRIPVMVSEGPNRDDFMCEADSADDWNAPIEGPTSFEYWDMIRDNLPEGGYDMGDERDENGSDGNGGAFICYPCNDYYRISDDCCLECHDAIHHRELCSNCDNALSECVCKFLDYADVRDGYGYTYMFCLDCNEYGYLMSHTHCAIDRHYSEALYMVSGMRTWERDLNGYVLAIAPAINVGAWHPEAILADAYYMHEEWLADEPRRNAQRDKVSALELLKIAVLNEASEYVIAYRAQELASAVKVLDAL